VTLPPSAPPRPHLSRYLHHLAMQMLYAEIGAAAMTMGTPVAHVLSAVFTELAAECERWDRAYDQVPLTDLAQDWLGGVGHGQPPPFP